MNYQRKDWYDEPDTRTPVNEPGLNDLENRIANAVASFQADLDYLMSLNDIRFKEILTDLQGFPYPIDHFVWRVQPPFTGHGIVVDLWGEVLNIGTVGHARLMVGLRVQNTSTIKPIPILDIDQTGAVASPTYLVDKNTTGLTNAQIDALIEYDAQDGMMIHDSTNHLLLVRQNGAWSKFHAT